MENSFNLEHSLFATWNEEEFARLVCIFRNDPLFIHFHCITSAMFDFLILEKLHLFMNDGTRKVVNETGEIISGYLQTFRHLEDEYHPQKFTPFMVSGYWIPKEEGELFLVEENLQSPFRRNKEGKEEVLFLVHPKSEVLFLPLTKLYNDTKIEVPALSLSSFRTLLVSLPGNDKDKNIFAFAKLSLDEKINNVSRIISRKESGGSIAATIAFKKKLLAMNEKHITSLRIMNDIMSFVPLGSLVGHSVNHHPDNLGGMIVREIPSFLLDPNTKERLVPVFSLLGVNNQPFFTQMILKSKRNHTQFLSEKILQPFSRVLVELLYSQHISIEAHGQNLLLAIDAHSLQPILGSEFMYRDMGGANVFLTQQELQSLPINLASEEYFYWDTFHVDAGLAIEYEFVKRVLFNLTKQLVKSQSPIRDNEFREWRLQMAGQGYLVNWTECNPNEPFYANDNHVEVLQVNQYMCYGYVEERKFKEILVKEMMVSFPHESDWLKSEIQRTYDIPYQSNQFKELIENTFLKIKHH